MIGWSTQNRAVSGDTDLGEIGSSSYVGNGLTGMVFILGDEDADTDEYDRHVVTHEWGHYFEDRVSRSDSVGGPHSLNSRLDPRVAMGEGWGNALSGIILGDTVYRDSQFVQQSDDFGFDVENNNNFPEGWFNEGSVQSIIYDIFDSVNDGADTVSLGLGPIYDALTNDTYIDQSTFTTIYSFVEQVRTEAPAASSGLDALLTAQSIQGSGFDGAGETNDGNIPTSLPVYLTATVGGPPIEVCSENAAGDFNRLANRRFIQLDIPTAGSYAFNATRTFGPTERDPDILVFLRGTLVAQLISPDEDTEVGNRTLQAGPHLVSFFDFLNLDDATDARTCFNLTVQAN